MFLYDLSTSSHLFYPSGQKQKETYGRDKTDPITQTGGPVLVSESWDSDLCEPGTWDPGTRPCGTRTRGPGRLDAAIEYEVWHLGGSRRLQNTPTGSNLPTCF